MTDATERRRSGRQPTQPCGTVAAYRRHRRAKEQPCPPCMAAWAERQRNQYAARQAKANRASL